MDSQQQPLYLPYQPTSANAQYPVTTAMMNGQSSGLSAVQQSSLTRVSDTAVTRMGATPMVALSSSGLYTEESGFTDLFAVAAAAAVSSEDSLLVGNYKILQLNAKIWFFMSNIFLVFMSSKAPSKSLILCVSLVRQGSHSFRSTKTTLCFFSLCRIDTVWKESLLCKAKQGYWFLVLQRRVAARRKCEG